jgi:ABC-type uncharacterized transport system substrate-binding protein
MRVKRLVPIIMVAVACLFITASAQAAGKVLFVDSYHQGYAWSDGIEQGIKKALEGSGTELKVVRMDTKRNTSEDFKKQAAEKVKAEIDQFKPNVVIAADDNASKYLIVPYYKGKELPFVFCGVNWDASGYGFPAKNVTGMIEVTPVDGLLAELKKFAKGGKVGFLGPDILTSHKEAENLTKVFGLKMTEYFAKDGADWMKGFKELQGKVDMLIIDSDGGLWQETKKEREDFVLKNTKIPTGSTYEFMAPYAIISFAKVAQEQGFWAGKAALEIIGGKAPSAIPVVKNKEGKLIVNGKIAQASGLKVPYEVISAADKVLE